MVYYLPGCPYQTEGMVTLGSSYVRGRPPCCQLSAWFKPAMPGTNPLILPVETETQLHVWKREKKFKCSFLHRLPISFIHYLSPRLLHSPPDVDIKILFLILIFQDSYKLLNLTLTLRKKRCMAQPLKFWYHKHKTKTSWHKNRSHVSMEYILSGPVLTLLYETALGFLCHLRLWRILSEIIVWNA